MKAIQYRLKFLFKAMEGKLYFTYRADPNIDWRERDNVKLVRYTRPNGWVEYHWEDEPEAYSRELIHFLREYDMVVGGDECIEFYE